MRALTIDGAPHGTGTVEFSPYGINIQLDDAKVSMQFGQLSSMLCKWEMARSACIHTLIMLCRFVVHFGKVRAAHATGSLDVIQLSPSSQWVFATLLLTNA